MAFKPSVPSTIGSTPDFDVQQQQLDYQRKLIDQLANAPMPQAQMVSGHYVAPGWMGALGALAQGATAGVSRGMLNQQESDLADKRSKAFSDWLGEYAKGTKSVTTPGQAETLPTTMAVPFGEESGGNVVPGQDATPATTSEVPLNKQERMALLVRGANINPLAKELVAGEIKQNLADMKPKQPKLEFSTELDDQGREIKTIRDMNNNGTLVRTLGGPKADEKTHEEKFVKYLVDQYHYDPKDALDMATNARGYMATAEALIPYNKRNLYAPPGGAPAAAPPPIASPGSAANQFNAVVNAPPPVASAPVASAGPAAVGGPTYTPPAQGYTPGYPHVEPAQQQTRDAGRIKILQDELQAELAKTPKNDAEAQLSAQNIGGIQRELAQLKVAPAIANIQPTGGMVPQPLVGAPPAPAPTLPQPLTPGGIAAAGAVAPAAALPPGAIPIPTPKADAAKLETRVEAYGNKLTANKVPELDNALSRVEQMIAKYPEGTDLPGFGSVKSQIKPGLMSEEGKKNRLIMEQLKGLILQAQAGLSQTESETKNVLSRIGMGPFQSDVDVRNAVKLLRDNMNKVYQGYGATYGPDVVNVYRQRMGTNQPTLSNADLRAKYGYGGN